MSLGKFIVTIFSKHVSMQTNRHKEEIEQINTAEVTFHFVYLVFVKTTSLFSIMSSTKDIKPIYWFLPTEVIT